MKLACYPLANVHVDKLLKMSWCPGGHAVQKVMMSGGFAIPLDMLSSVQVYMLSTAQMDMLSRWTIIFTCSVGNMCRQLQLGIILVLVLTQYTWRPLGLFLCSFSWYTCKQIGLTFVLVDTHADNEG